MPLEAEDKDANPTPTLTVIKGLLDSVGGGDEARHSVKRHYEHLEKLARDLRKLGMDEHAVDDNIMQIFREYERELISYVSKR